MPQTLLGIDIGTYSIKIAEIERTFSTFEFVNFYERKIQYNELLKPEESIAVTLQGMVDDFALRWDQVFLGYPGQKTSSRILTLPFGNLRKIDQTLDFELEGFVPFDLDTMVVDYYVLNATKESSDVMVFYTLRDDFVNWLSLIQNCRIDPKIVTIESTEFLNLVCLGMVPPESPYIILDIGHVKTNLLLCTGKKLSFYRSFSMGGFHLTQAIQNKLQVPFEEAERLKVEMGSLSSDEEKEALDDLSRQVSQALELAFEDWLVQVRQVIFAFRGRDKQPVEGIYLCGGTSRLPGLDRFLSQKLKQNVTYIDAATFPFTHLSKVASHRSVMPQGLALGLRGLAARGMPDLNLRQGEFVYKGDVEKLGGTFKHLGVALGIIFLLSLGYFGVKYYVLSREVAALNEQVTKMVSEGLKEASSEKRSSAAVALKLIKTKITNLERRQSALSEIKGALVVDILKDISQKVPARKEMVLDVEEFSIKGNKVNVKGVTDSFISVDKIKTALELSNYLEGVTPGSTRKGIKEDEYKFEMTMDLEMEKTAKSKTPEKKGKAKRQKDKGQRGGL